MKYLKYTFCFALVLFFTTIAKSQNTEPDAIYLKMLKEYTLNEDGSYSYHHSHRLKILSHFAFNRKYGQTAIEYNPKYQEVKVNNSVTFMADGKKVKTPENAFNEVLSYSARNTATYNHLRRYIITHTALEVGSVINVDYNVNTKTAFTYAFSAVEKITKQSPIEELIIIVRVPLDKELNYKLLNSDIRPEVISSEGKKVYTWRFNNLNSDIHEKASPHPSNYEPYLIFSENKSMSQVYKSFVMQEAFKYSLDEKMRKFCDKIDSENETKLDKILAIQNYVANNIKTFHIPFSKSGFIIQTPIEVYNSVGGTKLEKATLMAAMLNSMKIQAYPIMVAPLKMLDSKISNLNVFNDFILRINNLPEDFMYLPVDKSATVDLKYMLGGKKLVPIYPGLKSFEIFTETNKSNKIILAGNLKMDDYYNFKGDVASFITKGFNSYFNLKDEAVDKVINLYDGIKIEKSDKNNILQQKISVSSVKFKGVISTKEISASNFLKMKLPEFKNGLSKLHLPEMVSQRRNPILIQNPLVEKYVFKLKLSKDVELLNKNTSVNITNNIGSFTFIINKKGRKVEVVKTIEISKRIIEPADYDSLKELMTAWRVERHKELIFKQK